MIIACMRKHKLISFMIFEIVPRDIYDLSFSLSHSLHPVAIHFMFHVHQLKHAECIILTVL